MYLFLLTHTSADRSPHNETSSPFFNFSSTPPLCDTQVCTIDSLLIPSHYFSKHGRSLWLPLNQWPA